MSGDDGAAETFRTHANYLRAFASLAGLGLTVEPKRALSRLASLAAAFPVPRVTPGDPRLVFACLHRAWGTELLLNVGRRFATEDELVRLANSWGAVQAYYAAYGAVQALIVAEGRSRPESHPATQKQAVDLWANRSASLAPSSLAMGSPSALHADADGCINGPGRALSKGVHNWSACTPVTCWELAVMALRSTREDAIEEQLARHRREKLTRRKKEWRTRQTERVSFGKAPLHEPHWPRQATLTASETAQVGDSVRPHTMLDYLYRLRLKANYEDARMFTDGPQAPIESATVARDLVAVTSATLLVHEVRIAKLIGGDEVLREAESWLSHNSPPGPYVGLAFRLDVLRATL